VVDFISSGFMIYKNVYVSLYQLKPFEHCGSISMSAYMMRITKRFKNMFSQITSLIQDGEKKKRMNRVNNFYDQI